jgi:hypothetical protein
MSKSTRIGWACAAYLSFAASFLALCATVSCAGWDAVDRRSQEPVPGNPCGNLWHQCADASGKSERTCCPNEEACGPTCPADSCCDERDALVRGDAGLPAPRVTRPRRHLP